MGVTTTNNKPLNPRGNDQSPLAFNRAKLYSGKALDFDGTNDELSLDGFTMSGNTATLSFCLKADDWDANSFIFAAGTPEIVLGSTTGGNNLSFYDSSSWKTFGAISDTTSTNFFSIVFNGTSAIAYMNGVKFGNTLTITPINISSVADVKLMAQYSGGGLFFNGQLSGFKIFNTALTAAQVADLYNNPEKVVPTGVDNTALKLWLPMQEGAGTTAYDGSGNRNHGTISGATYTHGIGAPVSQTAVMNWNKGSNLVTYSEQFDNAAWTKSKTTITANDTTAPDGSANADKLEITTSGGNNELYRYVGTIAIGHALSVYVKKDTARWFALGTNVQTTKMVWFDLDNGVVGTEATGYTGVMTDEGNGWYRCGIIIGTGAATSTYIDMSLSNSDGVLGGNVGLSVFIWGAQVEVNDSIGAYIPTFATAQTSEVLLPQGLTTGRDITGVNLFENVRKQGALNLDGNSWAEVHENASIDISDCSLEAWIYLLPEGLGTWQTVFSKVNQANLQIYLNAIDTLRHYNSTTNETTLDSTPFNKNEWNHFILVEDGSDVLTYVNGVLKSTKNISLKMDGDGVFFIGAHTTSGADGINAQLAQPRIYNRALTAEEVQRNYNAGKNTYTN